MGKKGFKWAIVAAIISGLILYGAGFYTGLSFTKIVEDKTRSEIAFLTDYVNTLNSDVEDIQIQERFINTLKPEERCKFVDSHFADTKSNLEYYWSILPARLEDYEKNRVLSPEYQALKEQYTKLSLRSWITANQNYQDCNTKVIPVLYFYSTDCNQCSSQGEILDAIKTQLKKSDRTLLVFTIDANINDSTVKLIKNHYNIISTPAIIIDGETLQGRIFDYDEVKALTNAKVIDLGK